ncbi:unnamed protein product [Leuciscus chuanchicus]
MENDDDGNSLFCLTGMENGKGNWTAHTSVSGPMADNSHGWLNVWIVHNLMELTPKTIPSPITTSYGSQSDHLVNEVEELFYVSLNRVVVLADGKKQNVRVKGD